MKKIVISNGETRIGYEFKDLSEEAQNAVLNWWIEGEIQMMDDESEWYYLAEKMEKNHTPWFLPEEILTHHKDDIIETIEINEYLFDEYGEMFPITYHIGNDNQVTKIGFLKYECEILPFSLETA